MAGINVYGANLLTNPGFEEGQTGWHGLVRGDATMSFAIVVTNPAVAHSGNNYVSNYNTGGWSSVAQGDSAYPWSVDGTVLPMSEEKFYRLSAWVKVPGADVTPRAITLRYRFEPSGERVDVGQATISNTGWNQLISPWLKPPAGTTLASYYEVHTVNNSVVFYVDDCVFEEMTPLVLQGRVLNNGLGVDNATITATSADYTLSVPVTTAGGGYYSMNLPPGTYTIGANSPGFLGVTNVVVTASPATAPDILLGVDPDYDPDLLLFARSSALGTSGGWPTAFPAGGVMTRLGSPGIKMIGGQKWESNLADGQGFQALVTDEAIPVNGASIVVAVRPQRRASDNWDSVVDVFHNRLVLGVGNQSGLLQVWRNGTLFVGTSVIPSNQITILSLVVQPTGEFAVWTNGVMAMSNSTTDDMTSLVPNVPGGYANGIVIGKNKADPWPAFHGNIGDVYLYKIALDESKRTALESNLIYKFVTSATLTYSITASAGPNGSISPAGSTNILQGLDQKYTITANSGFVVENVLVDGISVGAVQTYTFSDLTTNRTISATFVSLPPQTITATAGANGSINPSGAVSVPAGSDSAFSIIPNAGYAVSDVIVDGVSRGEIYSYTFNFVTAPHTISVAFRPLSMNVPKVEQLIFGALSSVLPGDDVTTTNWICFVPADKQLVSIGFPTSTLIGTNIWEVNENAQGDGYRFPGGTGPGGEYLAPIPASGATIMVAAIANTTYSGGDPWTSIVDVFYGNFVLGIRNNNGEVVSRVQDTTTQSGFIITPGRPTVLSLVVQPDGSYRAWANGQQVISRSTGVPFTSLNPGALEYMHYINVGRNNIDGWTSFNGNIGDVFLYKTALTETERQQLESAMMAKIGAVLPPTTPSLPMSGLVITDGVPSFTFPTVTGIKYRLVYKDALTDANWLPVINGGNPAPGGWGPESTGENQTITDPDAFDMPQRFYRLQGSNL